MLSYFKFRRDLLDPVPAREAYVRRRGGRGWPEECPPLRAANSFGFDLLANFEVTFIQWRGRWRVEPDLVLESDFDWSGDEGAPGRPLTQQYAWFWQKGQTLPHPISDDVFAQIRHQVKLSTLLYLATSENELLYLTDVPNLPRPWRAMTALLDTDWYPASYPWHTVLELDRRERRIRVARGEPIARAFVVRRDTYFASPMSLEEFDAFFDRGQRWLEAHGRPHEQADDASHRDVTRTYVKQQLRSRFVVKE